MMARAGVNWRYTESPLVDGDWVVVTPGAPEAALVALDKMTGEEIWRSAIPELGGNGDDGAGYSSIVVSHGAGVKQYVQLMGRGLVGIRAEDGSFLWGYNRIANDVANIATPIVSGDYVFGSTGYQTGAALLELSRNGEGDGINAREVYFLEGRTFQNHHGGLILHEGYLYTGTGHNNGLPLSLQLETGAVVWGPTRNDGRNSAAITFADGPALLSLSGRAHDAHRCDPAGISGMRCVSDPWRRAAKLVASRRHRRPPLFAQARLAIYLRRRLEMKLRYALPAFMTTIVNGKLVFERE